MTTDPSSLQTLSTAAERRRSHLVRELAVMDDRRSQEAYDRITRVAKRIFDTDIVLITFMDHERQWYKSSIGTSETERPRDKTFCARTVARRAPVIVNDVLLDSRFSQQEWAVGPVPIRFYAGAPLLTHDGEAIGTICLAHSQPRAFSDDEIKTLSDLAAMVMNQVKLDRGLTYLDPITRLPNRVQFFDDILERLAWPRGKAGWVILIELMGLNEANEAVRALGLPYLHEHLVHATAIIRHALTEARIYHVGVTHLAFFLPPDANVTSTLDDLRNRLRAPFVTTDQVPAKLDPGFGIREMPANDCTPSEVVRTLLLAAREARESGIGISPYCAAADAAHQRAYRLLTQFPAALESGELFLVYQPRIDARTGRCVAAEALLRWRHPDHGLVSPGEFLPLIAKTGLMRGATQWVMETVVRQVGDWQEAGIDIRCSFNISAVNLEEPDLAERVGKATRLSNVDPRLLEIELVKDVSLLRDDASLARLTSLHDLGLTIAIDDFGSGYSNLAYLLELPARVLKLDRSIVAGVLDKQSYATAVSSIIGMAHRLGYTIVAEGIERQDVAKVLTNWGCDQLQGYMYARPLDPTSFAAWYAANSGNR